MQRPQSLLSGLGKSSMLQSACCARWMSLSWAYLTWLGKPTAFLPDPEATKVCLGPNLSQLLRGAESDKQKLRWEHGLEV